MLFEPMQSETVLPSKVLLHFSFRCLLSSFVRCISFFAQLVIFFPRFCQLLLQMQVLKFVKFSQTQVHWRLHHLSCVDALHHGNNETLTRGQCDWKSEMFQFCLFDKVTVLNRLSFQRVQSNEQFLLQCFMRALSDGKLALHSCDLCH